MKIRPVEAELFHADRWKDGRTDMTKQIVAFRNSANTPKVQLLAHTKHILPHVSAVDRHYRGKPSHSAETKPDFPQFI